MKECFITNRDIRTKFNPIFHSMKIRKLQNEIEELYHAGTTVTNYNYDLGEIFTRSYSAEDVAISIMSKKEYLLNQVLKYQRYIDMHDQALSKLKGSHQMVIYEYQSTGEYSKDYSRQYVHTILEKYKQALNAQLMDDDETITPAEVEQLSAIIDENVMYEPADRSEYEIKRLGYSDEEIELQREREKEYRAQKKRAKGVEAMS